MRATAVILICLALPAVWQSLSAQTASDVQNARDGLLRLLPDAQIDLIEASPLPGMLQILVGARVFYATADGRYLVEGRVIDTVDKKNLTARTQGEVRRRYLDNYPESSQISFVPADARYVITVFTDLDCPYCREMHSRIREYNLLGIGIRYMIWPRAGLGSPAHAKAIAVWCADDRQTALTEAKAGYNPPPRECDNPIAEHFRIGTLLGVNSTPNVVTEEGILIRGYAPPDELLRRLDSIERANQTGADQAHDDGEAASRSPETGS